MPSCIPSSPNMLGTDNFQAPRGGGRQKNCRWKKIKIPKNTKLFFFGLIVGNAHKLRRISKLHIPPFPANHSPHSELDINRCSAPKKRTYQRGNRAREGCGVVVVIIFQAKPNLNEILIFVWEMEMFPTTSIFITVLPFYRFNGLPSVFHYHTATM